MSLWTLIFAHYEFSGQNGLIQLCSIVLKLDLIVVDSFSIVRGDVYPPFPTVIFCPESSEINYALIFHNCILIICTGFFFRGRE